MAIADAGALARAAEILNVAQSALSHHMSEIEAELGVQLLDRLPRGVALTAAGKRLYEHATLIVAAMIKAEADVRTFTELATGPISLGLTHTVAAASGLEIMKAVGIACPAVHLMITEGLSPGLTDRLLAGDLDFALVFNPAADTRLARDPLLREELFLVGLEGFCRYSAGGGSWTKPAVLKSHHSSAHSAQQDHAKPQTRDRLAWYDAEGAGGRAWLRHSGSIDGRDGFVGESHSRQADCRSDLNKRSQPHHAIRPSADASVYRGAPRA